MDELTPLDERIIYALDDAHKKGEIELLLSELAKQVRITEEEATASVTSLLERGLLDRLEVADRACLSATGFRMARALRSGAIKPSIADPGVFAAEPAARVSGGSGALIDVIQAAFENFGPCVEESSLTAEEKSRLKSLQREFLLHPATLELLRRALRRTARRK